MGGRAYYNEIDPDAVAVLRQLIADGVIAPGDVDDRSIRDVPAADLASYTQCHFFAGGGLWSVAARLAGFPDDRELWTGSCPCQPFSAAGKRAGRDDPRHLWPDFHRLIRARRPALVMGEQVAGTAGYDWFDGVRADLAGENYASRSVDIPACAVDAPHQRNRLYWVAVGNNRHEHRRPRPGWPQPDRSVAAADGGDGEMADSLRDGNRTAPGHHNRPQAASIEDDGHPPRPSLRVLQHHGRNGSFWSDAEWIVCHDGKARRAKPDIRLLVNGLPGRVGLWRIGGNAISPVLAAEVIASFLETE